MKGIDVSTLQGTINWGNVAASGVKFAMIKASQGRGETAATKGLRNFTDGKFKANITGATAAGIACGAFHYMTAINEAEAVNEADYFCKTIAPYKDKLTLWAAVDVESTVFHVGLPKTQLTRAVRAFLGRVKAKGYKPMLYTNPDYYVYRYEQGAFADTDIWLAHWGVGKPMDVPHLQIWQTGSGRVSGINADCDLDIGYFEPVKAAPAKAAYTVGDKYTIRAGDKYSNGAAVPARLVGQTYTINQVADGRILLKEIMSWVRV